MRTLLVEDEGLQRESMRRELEALGLRVVAVPDAESAFAAHASEPFDLLIVDWVLPGIDGLRFVSRLRELPGGATPFVVVITARDRPEDLARVLDAGADDYLAKPIDATLLQTRIRIAARRVASRRLHEADREALERAQADFRRLLDRSPLGVIARSDEEIVYANAAASRITGYTREELLRRKIYEVFAAEDHETMRRRIGRFDRTGTPPPPAELTMVRPDKRALVVRLIPFTRAVFDNREVALVMFEDVTTRTLAERRLRMTQFAVDRARETVLWLDAQGTINYANAAAATLLETTSAELEGRRFEELQAKRREVPWDRWVAELEDRGSLVFETELRRPGGELVAIEASASALRFDGSLFVVIGARDLTERERLRETLAQAEKMASVGSLAAGVAHEINNPLAYVIANLELIAEEIADKPEGGNDQLGALVAAALDGSERVRRIVGDLRAFARQRDDRLEPVDIEAVLDSAVKLADNNIRHRARLVRSTEPVPHVIGNEQRLTQVFVNLLLNAAQAIPDGARQQHTIALTTSARAGGVEVAVEDTGTGIDPKIRDRIFEPFFTTKRQGEGTGLGLAICHGIIANVGGRIEVDSELGKGATFRVWLPAAPQPAAGATSRSPKRPVPVRMRVLVVDDEPLIGESVKRALDQHDVDIVTSGREAIERCHDTRYDLVLCDLMMPDTAGMDVYARVCAEAPELAQRFLFMTGGAFSARATAFLEAHGMEPLTKPFSLRELRDFIDRHAR